MRVMALTNQCVVHVEPNVLDAVHTNTAVYKNPAIDRETERDVGWTGASLV